MARISLKRFAFMAIIAATVSGASYSMAAETTSMRDTVANTMANNPNIKAFQEYRQAAEHDLKRARSGWFPRLDARAGYGMDQWNDDTTRNKRNSVRKGAFYDRGEASLTISQTIWDGMATWNRVNIGKHRLDSANSRLFDNAEGLTLDALLAHIEVFRQRRIVALAELNVRNHKEILASQIERQRSGASTMADVTQTQGRLARTEASLAESRSALEVAMANYKRLTGRDAFKLDPPSAPQEAYPSLDAALAHVMSGNLKIKALRSDAASADAQTELDKSPFHPQIYLEAGPNYRSNVESSDTYAWGNVVMLRANWNLLNGGYDWYNVKGDKARARQARQEITALNDSLTEETTATWSALISAQEQSRFYANAVDYSTKTRNMYLEQFNVGQRSLLDVLDAENELFSSSIQYVTAQQNVIAAKYRLLALGGDLIANFGLERQALAIKTDQ